MPREITPLIVAAVLIATASVTALADSISDRDFDTRLRWRSVCPQTREEIANLKQCIQCPRANDDYLTKVCCPPNDRFDGAKGGCVFTADEITCRTRQDVRRRRKCYETFLPPSSQDATSPVAPPESPPIPQRPPSPIAPPVDSATNDFFEQCVSSCELEQRYLWTDLIGCQNACHQFSTDGCPALRRYCLSLRVGYLSCQSLYRSLCY